MVSLTLVVYVQTDVSWSIGLAIPTIFMLVSGFIYFLGSKIYVKVKPEGSPFTSVVQVLVVATKKRRLKLPEQPWLSLFNYAPTKSINSKLGYTEQFRFLDNTAIVNTRPKRQFRRINSRSVESLHFAASGRSEMPMQSNPNMGSSYCVLYCNNTTAAICSVSSPSIQQTFWGHKLQNPCSNLHSILHAQPHTLSTNLRQSFSPTTPSHHRQRRDHNPPKDRSRGSANSIIITSGCYS